MLISLLIALLTLTISVKNESPCTLTVSAVQQDTVLRSWMVRPGQERRVSLTPNRVDVPVRFRVDGPACAYDRYILPSTLARPTSVQIVLREEPAMSVVTVRH